MPFQREGVEFGLARGGRCLLADEMGLGKTLQALTIAAQYPEEWPVLVVAPATLRLAWREQALQWLPNAFRERHEVQVLMNGKQLPDTAARLVVVSYELLVRHPELHVRPDGEHFQVVIVDESQYIKSARTGRSRAVLQICERARRCVLISGTPILNRTSELYTQLQAIFPDVSQNLSYADFCSRYGNGNGNRPELHAFLTTAVLTRRLKRDVLRELPQKVRQRITLEPEKLDAVRMAEVKQHLADGQVADEMACVNSLRPEQLPAVMRAFRAAAEAKIQCVILYMEHLLADSEVKMLLFAHHHVMLDALEQRLRGLRTDHVRIDGRTPQCARPELVKRFQSDKDVRVALLSITACGQGLTLTAARLVVFAELHWVPGLMLQAEDRAHRIGQRMHVDVRYCIAEGTLDERMFELLNRKHRDASGILDGAERSMEVQQGSLEPREAHGASPAALAAGIAALSCVAADEPGCAAPGAVADEAISPRSAEDHPIVQRPAALGGGPFGARRKRARVE